MVVEQLKIPRVEMMPDFPAPYQMKDWKAAVRAFDALAFDFEATGEHLPLIWFDDSARVESGKGVALPSYVGGPPEPGGDDHEAIATLGAVVGASVADINKRIGKHDFVAAALQYFNDHNDEYLVLNNPDARSGLTYWYEIFPHILFYILVDLYPRVPELPLVMQVTADRWCEAVNALKQEEGGLDFEHTAFDFQNRKPMSNGKWVEPDAAGGIAWLLHMAWRRWPRREYLEAVFDCMDYLDGRDKNAVYEIMMPFAVTLAARLNAQHRKQYDVEKFFSWCLEPSDSRPGWGVIAERWGDYDCFGLCGSVTDGGGYAFAMNTFLTTAILTPVVRYDQRFARAVGKWMLNAANASRLFYPEGLPAHMQSCPEWEVASRHAICYEGLRKIQDGKSPFATGDPTQLDWGPLDFAIYGAAYAGFFAAVIDTTNVEGILKIDCRAVDFFPDESYPTFLYYNPHQEAKVVEVDLGRFSYSIYDSVAQRWLTNEASGEYSFEIAGGDAAVLVLAPAKPRITTEAPKLKANGVVIDYRY